VFAINGTYNGDVKTTGLFWFTTLTQNIT
jgi:hypothetical protein